MVAKIRVFACFGIVRGRTTLCKALVLPSNRSAAAAGSWVYPTPEVLRRLYCLVMTVELVTLVNDTTVILCFRNLSTSTKYSELPMDRLSG
jgi:hypothetical protein